MKAIIKILDSGWAVCHTNPGGAYGLEGYSTNNEYRFEICQRKDRKYYRVYPDKGFPEYYETCNMQAFNKFFRRKIIADVGA